MNLILKRVKHAKNRCQNRVTIGQIVTQMMRTTQGMMNLILKTCQACQKSCHDCSKSCHDLPPEKHHAHSLPNRVTILHFLIITFLSHIATVVEIKILL